MKNVLHTLESGAVDGAGVAARVAGTERCKFDRVVRNVPYLLGSPDKPATADSPVDGCAPASEVRRKEDAVGIGDTMPSDWIAV